LFGGIIIAALKGHSDNQ